MINDFKGTSVYFYTFQNTNIEDLSTIHLNSMPFTSTIIQLNQLNINNTRPYMGTVVSEYSGGTSNQIVTQFGLKDSFTPVININSGPNNEYNSYVLGSELASMSVGKAINDYNGNLYESSNTGDAKLYRNIGSTIINMSSFTNMPLQYASPKTILSKYQADTNANPFYDFFVSKYTNIWHLQGTSNLSTIYGVRLTSQYDTTIYTNFINQIFYPTHKITMIQNTGSINPMIAQTDLITYPSYPRTEMFYYTSASNMSNDINGKFAQEKTSNFAYNDMTSGYFLNSYINNIIMRPSLNEYNYLAIRAYSPSETFKTLVRFSLPGRYDFGYVTLKDLSNEIITLQSNTNVNPVYIDILSQYNSSFMVSRLFGSNGYPGYPGLNINADGFGKFISQYSTLYNTNASNSATINNINNSVKQATSTLIGTDLKYILPSYIITRDTITDPLEFKLPFSTINTVHSSGCIDNVVNITNNDQYGLGYNLGYSHVDTGFNTFQRAGSFFKILDDYIYLKMNPEFNMNRLDISRPEDLSATRDSMAESQLYNCKLLLNTFGTYSTTFIQNPVLFNPPIGKLDKLSFTWYDIHGNPIDNSECEWSATLQIVERSDIATDDSTAARPQV